MRDMSVNSTDIPDAVLRLVRLIRGDRLNNITAIVAEMTRQNAFPRMVAVLNVVFFFFSQRIIPAEVMMTSNINVDETDAAVLVLKIEQMTGSVLEEFMIG